MKKIVLTGGGTAGHVNPNLALVPELESRGYSVYYIGGKGNIESKLVNGKCEYFEISCGKLRRYFDIKNFTDGFKIIKGIFDALLILKKVKPNVVFSKGGFVTVPVVIAGKLLGIPCVIHESDYTPGLANKISYKFCNNILVSFTETKKFVDSNAKVVGSPIRHEILNGNPNAGKSFLNFENDLPIMLIMGGSLGAKAINDSIRANLDDLTKDFNVVHLCGKGKLIENINKNYKQFEYIDKEMGDILNCADIVISRAGANSVFELLALNKPNLLIPLSKKVSRGDQILNANSFKNAGYSEVLEEENISELKQNVYNLYENKDKYIRTMQQKNSSNSVKLVVDEIDKVANKKTS